MYLRKISTQLISFVNFNALEVFMTGTTKYQVNCPLTLMNEYVYVHSINTEDYHIALFAGCDNNYRSSEKCFSCCLPKIQKMYEDSYCGDKQLRWHTPE